jgi:hypothetical protein
MGLQHSTQDTNKIPLKYNIYVLFNTKYTHPTLICRGTDGRTDARTDGKYLLNIQGYALAPWGARTRIFVRLFNLHLFP